MDHKIIFVFIFCCIFVTYVGVCNGERRIYGGQDITVDHKYMVYLRRAELELKNFTAWLCGGALIGKKTVLTSAACVKDITYIYVIAGLKNYVPEENETNQCISKTKRQVVHICVPKAYNLEQEFIKWSALDIAVVMVNKEIIGDQEYVEYCNYAPTTIDINLDQEELQLGGREVLMLGWGSNGTWRLDNDTTDYNSEKLKYAPSRIVDKKNCTKLYEHFNMTSLINKYMICTLEKAPFDDRGERLTPADKKKIINFEKEDGCSSEEGNENVEKLADFETRPKRKKKLNKLEYVRSGYCSLSAHEKGFDIIQRHITWSSPEELATDNPDEVEPTRIEASQEGTGESQNMMDEKKINHLRPNRKYFCSATDKKTELQTLKCFKYDTDTNTRHNLRWKDTLKIIGRK